MADIKLEEKDLQELHSLRKDYQQAMFDVGQSEFQLYDLELAIKEIEKAKKGFFEKYENLKKLERQKLEELNKKYGDGNLNIDSGIFTPSNSQSGKPKENQ